MKEKYMLEALKQAKIAYNNNDVPIGCVIVKDNIIIGKGFNTRNLLNDSTGHAEINAIREANKTMNNWVLEDCDLYVTVEPCQMCAGAIIQSRIRKVYFGARDYKAGCAVSLYNMFEDERFNHQVEYEENILQEECSSIIKLFFKQLRKKNKK